MVYKVKFNLLAPVSIQEQLHFDALLSAVNPLANNKRISLNAQSSKEMANKMEHFPLPVKRLVTADSWVYCASAIFFPPETQIDKSAFIKRRTAQDVEMFERKLRSGAGVMRDKLVKPLIFNTPYVYFLVDSTDKGSLESLCSEIISIGGLRKQGYGEVQSVEISEMKKADWTSCIIKDGYATRRLPSSFVEAEYYIKSTVRAPYWLQVNKEACVDVGQDVRLKQDILYMM
jgi:hypothetical protein